MADTTTTRIDADTLDEMFRNAAGYVAAPKGWTPVGAWIRVSSGGQDEALQVPQVIRYCIDHHYWVTRWYVIHAKSAFKGLHQKDLDRALDDMRHGLTLVLVIWHSDRLERRHERIQGKSETLPDTLAEFVDAGGHVESLQEPQLGQSDFGSQVTTYITSLVNRDKSAHISEQVRLAQDQIRANGATANRIPWGYYTEGTRYNRKLVATDLAREIIPQIFQQCIDGKSRVWIARWLDTLGIPSEKGGKWNEGSIGHLLHNRTYAGRRTRRGDAEIYQRCDTVISMDLFNRAQAALNRRPKRGPVSKNPANRPKLAKLRCLRCGGPMYRHPVPDGRVFYRCTGSGAQRKGCGNLVPYAQTETIIVDRIFMTDTRPHPEKKWVAGKNWDNEIAEVTQDIHELVQKPLAVEGFMERMGELHARLAEYTRLNDTRSKGEWEVTYTRRSDGSLVYEKPDGSLVNERPDGSQVTFDSLDDLIEDLVQEGEYFDNLDDERQREYLKTHDIWVEKVVNPPLESGASVGIRVKIDLDDPVVIPYAPKMHHQERTS